MTAIAGYRCAGPRGCGDTGAYSRLTRHACPRGGPGRIEAVLVDAGGITLPRGEAGADPTAVASSSAAGSASTHEGDPRDALSASPLDELPSDEARSMYEPPELPPRIDDEAPAPKRKRARHARGARQARPEAESAKSEAFLDVPPSRVAELLAPAREAAKRSAAAAPIGRKR